MEYDPISIYLKVHYKLVFRDGFSFSKILVSVMKYDIM